jgi:hypothetical protein
MSNFQAIKESVQAVMNSKGFKMFTPNAHRDGNVTLTHYMGILQKAASLVQDAIIADYCEARGVVTDENYDWKADPDKHKAMAKANHGLDFYQWLGDEKILEGQLPKKYRDVLNRNIAILADTDHTGVTITSNKGVWTIIDPEVPVAVDDEENKLSLQEVIERQRGLAQQAKAERKQELYEKFNKNNFAFTPPERTFKNPNLPSSSSSESLSRFMDTLEDERRDFLAERKARMIEQRKAKQQSNQPTTLSSSFPSSSSSVQKKRRGGMKLKEKEGEEEVSESEEEGEPSE